MNFKHLASGIVVLIGAFLFVSGLNGSTGQAAAFDNATVYYSTTCGCCSQHIGYLERAGVEVEKVEMNNQELSQLKDDENIPEDYRSCHTTVVNGKFVEGHVPVEMFNEFVEEDPGVDGITLPGMPQGSPGMPGTKTGEWTFHSIEDGEKTGEFTRK